MKTQEQILEEVQTGALKSRCIDGRDFYRLIDFFPITDWPKFGYEPKKDVDLPSIDFTPQPWTRESIVERLKGDLKFGIEKAQGERGISANLMYEVVCMWLHILDDKNEYSDYGKGRGYGSYFFSEVKDRYCPEPVQAT